MYATQHSMNIERSVKVNNRSTVPANRVVCSGIRNMAVVAATDPHRPTTSPTGVTRQTDTQVCSTE